VKSHYGQEQEYDLDPHAQQIFRKDVLLAGVEDSRNDEKEQEKEELVSRKDGALTPGVVCEDVEPEERYASTSEVAREDPEPEVRNPSRNRSYTHRQTILKATRLMP
jgi:hypothetical protein